MPHDPKPGRRKVTLAPAAIPGRRAGPGPAGDPTERSLVDAVRADARRAGHRDGELGTAMEPGTARGLASEAGDRPAAYRGIGLLASRHGKSSTNIPEIPLLIESFYEILRVFQGFQIGLYFLAHLFHGLAQLQTHIALDQRPNQF